jgi:hypothetical protein
MNSVGVATITNPIGEKAESVRAMLSIPVFLEAQPEIAALNQGVKRLWMMVIGQN